MRSSGGTSEKKVLKWLLWGSTITTLIFWSNLADPFNNPKSWALYMLAAYLLGWVIFQYRRIVENVALRDASILILLFMATNLFSLIFTEPKYIGLFGENARRTGFLTYAALSIVSITAAVLFSNEETKELEYFVPVVSIPLGMYGLLQHFHIDFIQWNNPYNSVLSTLGNPDFASALMGIFMVLSFGILMNSSKTLGIRVLAFLSALLLLATILFSQARQGLISGILGCFFVLVIWARQKNFYFFLSFLIAGSFGLITGILGMLNHGPLAGLVYKESISLRGDYWRAGMRMLKSHFWSGVGLDRYGAYFRQYRDAKQANRHSFDTVANAAHNVVIQLGATGGIFVVSTYVFIIAFVGWRAFVLIRSTSGNAQVAVGAITGAWIAYEAQSFISIDNIGISVWGWVLAGCIVGLSAKLTGASVVIKQKNNKSEIRRKSRSTSTRETLQPLISGIAVTMALAFIIPLFLADSSIRLSRSYAKPKPEQEQAYSLAVRKPLLFGIVDPYNRAVVGTILASNGLVEQGTILLQEALKSDPRNFEALRVISLIYEQTNQLNKAVETRSQMAMLDPYNREVSLALAQDFQAIGKVDDAKRIFLEIVRTYPLSNEAKTVHSKFNI